jgi:hypothetical protein
MLADFSNHDDFRRDGLSLSMLIMLPHNSPLGSASTKEVVDQNCLIVGVAWVPVLSVLQFQASSKPSSE